MLYCAVFTLVKLISGSDLSHFDLYNGKSGKILLKIKTFGALLKHKLILLKAGGIFAFDLLESSMI